MEDNIKLYTVVETADMLGISDTFLYKIAKQGKINFYRLGTNMRFSAEQIREYLSDKENAPDPRQA